MDEEKKEAMVTLHPVFPVFLFLLFNIIHELHFFKNCNALFEEYIKKREEVKKGNT